MAFAEQVNHGVFAMISTFELSCKKGHVSFLRSKRVAVLNPFSLHAMLLRNDLSAQAIRFLTLPAGGIGGFEHHKLQKWSMVAGSASNLQPGL